jgi:drug/metabolite transporter (DMT)-like permease
MQAVVYLIVILAQGSAVFGIKGERLALLSRCLNGFLAVSCAYLAFRLIPLGDASSIVFSSPIFVTVIACFLLKEPCGLFQGFMLVMGIGGVTLICKPSFLFGQVDNLLDEEHRLVGTMFALIASVCAGLVFVTMRKLPKTPSSVSIFNFSVFSFVAGSIVLLVLQEFKVPSSPRVWVLLIGTFNRST